MKTVIYIAGPMTGYPEYNFPAFHEAERELRDMLDSHGDGEYEIINPARIDEDMGFDPKTDVPTASFLADARRKDIIAINDHATHMVMLKGWERSRGACAEKALAHWKGIEVMDYETFDTLPSPHETPPAEDVLEEALRLTSADRQAQYGPPNVDFAVIAGLWSALKGVAFEPKEVAMFMVCVKLSREKHRPKRDNWVDIAGYARCGFMVTP